MIPRCDAGPYWQEPLSPIPVLLWSSLAILPVLLGPSLFGCVEPWSLGIYSSLAFLLAAVIAIRPISRSITRKQLLLVCALLLPPAIHALKAMLGKPLYVAYAATMIPTLPWITAAAYAVICSMAFTIPAARRTFPWVLFLSGVALAVFGIAQSGQGNHSFYGIRSVIPGAAPFGPFYNHNHAAAFLGLSLFSGIGILRSDWTTDSGYLPQDSLAPNQWAKRFLLAFFLALIAWGLFAISSRGSQLSIGICASIWLLRSDVLRSSRQKRILATAALLFALAAILREGPWSLSKPADNDPQESTVLRISMYQSTWVMIQDFPLLGPGLASFRERFPLYREASFPARTDNAHSDWLMLGAELGIPGAFVIFTLFTMLSIGPLRTPASSAHADSQRTCAISAGALSMVLHGIFDCISWIPALLTVLALSLAWLASDHGSEPSNHSPLIPPFLMRTVLGLLALSGLLTGFRLLTAEAHSYRAKSVDAPSRSYHLQAAQSWAPGPAPVLRLAGNYLSLAKENPLAAGILTSNALLAMHSGVRASPTNPHMLRLTYALLYHMGRASDAHLCANRANALDPLGK